MPEHPFCVLGLYLFTLCRDLIGSWNVPASIL